MHSDKGSSMLSGRGAKPPPPPLLSQKEEVALERVTKVTVVVEDTVDHEEAVKVFINVKETGFVASLAISKRGSWYRRILPVPEALVPGCDSVAASAAFGPGHVASCGLSKVDGVWKRTVRYDGAEEDSNPFRPKFAMDAQPFRLTGTREIVTIPIQHADGQNLVCWEAIEQVFPGVKSVSHGDVQVSRYIKHVSDVVLRVTLSNPTDHVRVDSAVGVSGTIPSSAQTVSGTDVRAGRSSDHSIEDNFVEGLRVSSVLAEMPIGDISAHTLSAGSSPLPPTLPYQAETPSKIPLSFKQVVKMAATKANQSEGRAQQQDLNAKMAYMIS
ncbi:hypothetical protein BGZ72_002240, partial [Mortierella alpina]